MLMNNYYNCLSPGYGELFIRNIEEFKRQAGKNRKYAVFYPSFGAAKNENPEFLVYGQAVKGWGSIFNSSLEINKEQLLKEAIEYSNDFYKEKNHSPLDWVNVYWGKNYYRRFVTTQAEKEFYPPMSYSTSMSFFWNVTYKIICRYYGLDENSWDWSKRLVWSNLYKIAPAERKNPNDIECKWQEKLSIDLVKKEIEEITPKFCIVLTNDSWWQPFRNNLNTQTLQFQNQNKGIVESVEQYKDTKIIVTTRPFKGSSDKHVKQILEVIK